MNQAIAELLRTAEIAEHNLPYSEAAGDIDQADLQRDTAEDCHAAIELLQQSESPG